MGGRCDEKIVLKENKSWVLIVFQKSEAKDEGPSPVL
jgi:hypothetical protein